MLEAEDRRELKLALFHISFFLSAGTLFMLMSFLIPGVSKHFQMAFLQTATVSFVATAVIIRRHPVVWSPIILRWSGQRNKKPKQAVPFNY